jgi:hypothetical protein
VTALILVTASASAATIEEIVALSRSGVSDEIVLALIERDRTIYTLSPEEIPRLKADGLSDAVLLAILKSGRQGQPADPPAFSPSAASMPTPPPAPAPEVLIVGHGPDRPNAGRDHRAFDWNSPVYVVPVPVVVGATGLPCHVRPQASPRTTSPTFGRFMNDPSMRFLNVGPTAPRAEIVVPADCVPVVEPARSPRRRR